MLFFLIEVYLKTYNLNVKRLQLSLKYFNLKTKIFIETIIQIIK